MKKLTFYKVSFFHLVNPLFSFSESRGFIAVRAFYAKIQPIVVRDKHMGEAHRYIIPQKRAVILLSFFGGYNDTEVTLIIIVIQIKRHSYEPTSHWKRPFMRMHKIELKRYIRAEFNDSGLNEAFVIARADN